MDYYKRYEEELKLKGYAQRSIQSYTRALRQLQNYCRKTLEEITEETQTPVLSRMPQRNEVASFYSSAEVQAGDDVKFT